MSDQLTNESNGCVLRQLAIIDQQVREPNGYPFDVDALRNALRSIIDGDFRIASASSFPFGPSATGEESGTAPTVRFPRFDPATCIGPEWRFGRDDEKVDDSWDPSFVTIVQSLHIGETSITGEEAIKRVSRYKLLGARAFWYFLKHPHQLPEECKGRLIFFDATELVRPNGNRYVPYLSWQGDGWAAGYAWIGICDRAGDCFSLCVGSYAAPSV